MDLGFKPQSDFHYAALSNCTIPFWTKCIMAAEQGWFSEPHEHHATANQLVTEEIWERKLPSPGQRGENRRTDCSQSQALWSLARGCLSEPLWRGRQEGQVSLFPRQWPVPLIFGSNILSSLVGTSRPRRHLQTTQATHTSEFLQLITSLGAPWENRSLAYSS